MSFFQPQNPGIGGLDELTAAEEAYLTTFAGLSFNEGDFLTISSGSPAWTALSVTPTWGNITGTLSDQTDLQSALDVKIDSDQAIMYSLML